MTSEGSRPRSASRTRVWKRRSATSPTRASRSRRSAHAGRLGHGIVLGGDEDLGGLLGHLARGGVDAGVEQGRRVGAGRAGRRRDRRWSPRASRARRSPGCAVSAGAPSASKQLRVSRWHVGPCGVDGEQQGVAVAVDLELDHGQRVCRSSRPCARGGRASASGSGPRRSRSSRRAPPRPCRPASGRGHPTASWTIAGTRPVAGKATSGARAVAVTRRPPGPAGPAGRPRPWRP